MIWLNRAHATFVGMRTEQGSGKGLVAINGE